MKCLLLQKGNSYTNVHNIILPQTQLYFYIFKEKHIHNEGNYSINQINYTFANSEKQQKNYTLSFNFLRIKQRRLTCLHIYKMKQQLIFHFVQMNSS